MIIYVVNVSLSYIAQKIKQICGKSTQAVIIISFMVISFELGTLTPNKQKHHDIYKIPAYFEPIFNKDNQIKGNLEQSSSQEKGQYVASKNGTKYYFVWCSGVSRIKDENKVFFQKKEDAEVLGYEPSSTCVGL